MGKKKRVNPYLWKTGRWDTDRSEWVDPFELTEKKKPKKRRR